MPNNQNRLEIANEVRDELARENVLSATQARAFVRCLQTNWEVPPIRWRESESQEQLKDARRLLLAADIFRSEEGINSFGAVHCYRRAGELLEWLSRAKDDLRLIIPIDLFAAAAFQLGGMPAMAMGLIREVNLDGAGSQLFAKFLQADFDGVIQLTTDFWAHHPELTDRAAPRRLLMDFENGGISWYFTVELVRSLGLISDSLRRGENARLVKAIEKLDSLEKMATRTFSEDTSLLISLMRAVANNYNETNIYHPIKLFSQINPEREARLNNFARGQFSRGRGILWSSQRSGLERLLHSSSFALCTPTGSGKTLVANLALVKELLLSPNDDITPLALYLVPSRALAGEVEMKLHSELGEDFIITGLYGGADWGITDYWLNADRPTVLIATVEKADALMRYVAPLLLSRIRLLIIDEAHQVVPENNENTRIEFAEHSSRSLRLEGFVSRLLALAPDIARIALTAVAGGASTPVARWIEGQPNATAVASHYRSTRQLIGALETFPESQSRILINIMNGHQLSVTERNQPVYIPLNIPTMPQLPSAMRNSLYQFNELSVLWTALHLAESERRILISVAQEPEKTMGWYKKALVLPSWNNTPRFNLPVGKQREQFNEARSVAIDYCGEDSYEVALLDRGIATSHGQMPQRLRRLMNQMIDSRICPITLATATLTEGVNLPFDIIFVTSLKRVSFNPDTERQIINPLPIAEFRNLAGRAGRPGVGKGLEGLTLIALPQRISTTASGERQKQARQLRELNLEYESLLRRLIADNQGIQNISSPLAILLQLLFEQASRLIGIEDDEEFMDWLDTATPFDISGDAGTAETSPEARLADSLDELDGILLSAVEELRAIREQTMTAFNTEAYLIQLWQKTFSNVAAAQEEWLETVFIRRGNALIENIYPDEDERKRLYMYGFTPYVGKRFEIVASDVYSILVDANEYGNDSVENQVSLFKSIGELICNDRGFGFRARNTNFDRELLDDWHKLLEWWMQVPDATAPTPDVLRAWQRFITDNIEFRLGVVIGAVVAKAWTEGADDPLAIPSLDEWRATTGLPWFGFWARELLRWGTLNPFVAFSLAQGLAKTREEATSMHHEYEEWLDENYEGLEPDDFIDPKLFLEWEKSLTPIEVGILDNDKQEAELTGANGEPKRYSVIPIQREDHISWIDAAGYELAQSDNENGFASVNSFRNDYDLKVTRRQTYIKPAFMRS